MYFWKHNQKKEQYTSIFVLSSFHKSFLTGFIWKLNVVCNLKLHLWICNSFILCKVEPKLHSFMHSLIQCSNKGFEKVSNWKCWTFLTQQSFSIFWLLGSVTIEKISNWSCLKFFFLFPSQVHETLYSARKFKQIHHKTNWKKFGWH